MSTFQPGNLTGWGSEGVTKRSLCPKYSFNNESRRGQEEGGELDSQEEANPEEIKSREVVLGYRERAGLLLQLFPNGGATDTVLATLFCKAVGTAIAWCCGRCALSDGLCLNTMLFWRPSTAALVFRVGACFEVSLFCPPFPLVPVPNRPSRLRGLKQQKSSSIRNIVRVQELCESRGGRPGLSVLTVSVAVKQH